MADVPVPLTILEALADETLRRLALASEVEHPGESGRAREQILTAFIEQLVPSSFSVATGFVVDALGARAGKSMSLCIAPTMPRCSRSAGSSTSWLGRSRRS